MNQVAAKAILSFWRRHPFQLMTLILGLSMATALWTGVQAINAESRAAYDRAADLGQLTSLPELTRSDGRPLSITDFARLRRLGWPVTPVLSGPLPTNGPPVSLYGIDPLTHPLARTLAQSDTPVGGFGQDPTLLADAATASRLVDMPEIPDITITDQAAPGQVIADIGLAADLLGQPAGLSSLALTNVAPGEIPDGFHLSPAPRATDVRGLTDSFHLNLTAFGALSFAVGLFIVQSGIGLAIEQRRTTFRTMRAIGVPLRNLIVLLCGELFLLALLAGFIGLILGYLIAASLMPNVSATLQGLYGAPGADGLTLRSSWIFAGLGMALIGTVVAGVGAVRKTARMPLLVTGKVQAWASSSRRTAKILSAFAMLLLLSGIAAFTLISGLVGAFALLAGVLLFGALVLPAVLGVVLKSFETRANRPMARWFWADTNAQIPGLNLALMALLLALSANIGVGTMVSSFRQAFTEFLDQRLVSDLYVSLPANATPEDLHSWADREGASTVPIWHVDATLFDRPAEIYGVSDHPIYAAKWPMQTARLTVWQDLHDGGSALISEQLARRAGLSVGDSFSLEPGWTTEIVGIYSDYGNPGGQVVVGLAEFLERHPNVPKSYHGVMAEGQDARALRNSLITTFEIPETAVILREDVVDFSLGIFERTFSVTGALNVLTLGVAGFAILTSLLSLSAMRLPQLAPVWAIGISRATLGRAELLRAGILAVLTFIMAVPLGLALAYVLLKFVNAEAFGWRLPMAIFPWQIGTLLILAVLAALLSAAWPALQLMRVSPARLTQEFAHER